MDLVQGPKNTARVTSPEAMAGAHDLKQRPRKTESGSAGQDGSRGPAPDRSAVLTPRWQSGSDVPWPTLAADPSWVWEDQGGRDPVGTQPPAPVICLPLKSRRSRQSVPGTCPLHELTSASRG